MAACDSEKSAGVGSSGEVWLTLKLALATDVIITALFTVCQPCRHVLAQYNGFFYTHIHLPKVHGPNPKPDWIFWRGDSIKVWEQNPEEGKVRGKRDNYTVKSVMICNPCQTSLWQLDWDERYVGEGNIKFILQNRISKVGSGLRLIRISPRVCEHDNEFGEDSSPIMGN